MNTMHRHPNDRSTSARAWLGLALAALTLAGAAGCGGGGNDVYPPPGAAPPPAPLASVPLSALISVRAYTEFVASLAPTDSGMALTLPAAAAPTSESDAPFPVN